MKKEIRVGTVLVFKDGVSKQQAEEALKKLRDLIDSDYYVAKAPPVYEFDVTYGGPVWYIP